MITKEQVAQAIREEQIAFGIYAKMREIRIEIEQQWDKQQRENWEREQELKLAKAVEFLRNNPELLDKLAGR